MYVQMIDVGKIQNCLTTKYLQPRFLIREIVDSTNAIAKDEILNKEQEGLIVIAEQQKLGRGRYDRKWHSPRGGLYFSLVLPI